MFTYVRGTGCGDCGVYSQIAGLSREAVGNELKRLASKDFQFSGLPGEPENQDHYTEQGKKGVIAPPHYPMYKKAFVYAVLMGSQMLKYEDLFLDVGFIKVGQRPNPAHPPGSNLGYYLWINPYPCPVNSEMPRSPYLPPLEKGEKGSLKELQQPQYKAAFQEEEV
jgi:hypothetical protein